MTAVGLATLALASAAYLVWSQQGIESTEDAYVEGNAIVVTPQTTGTVAAIAVDSTDQVGAGQVLVRLNPVDAEIALERAKAQLAKVVRQVRGQFSQAAQFEANITLRRSDLAKAVADVERRRPLAKTGAVSAEDLRHAEEAVEGAKAALQVAEQQQATTQALIDRTTVEFHPDVLVAASQLRDAYLAVARSELRAPVGGVVTRRSVQVGQRVSPGVALMTVVPLDQIWVSANFKESQLASLRAGQAVKLTSDAYGKSVAFHGRIVGLDAGTGSAFALMPAQNATGNWIKVVQRVPVRIAIDAQQMRDHPLRVGLSMRVEVDIHNHAGEPLAAQTAAPIYKYETKVLAEEQLGADSLVRQIIAENSRGGAGAGKRRSS